MTHLVNGYIRDVICNNTPMVFWVFFLDVFLKSFLDVYKAGKNYKLYKGLFDV